MKTLVSILLLLRLSVGLSIAQTPDAARFTADLEAIVDDAAKGFPTATGAVKEDIGWYGRKYESRLSFFGSTENTWLQWEKAQDNKYSDPTPERFYFYQSFPAGSAQATFMASEGERIIDAAATRAGMKKRSVKQPKDYKYLDETAWGTGRNTPAFSLTRNEKSGNYSLKIYSGYRPGDVKVPNLLGCMVFTSSGSIFMYVVPVYGANVPDKETLASKTMTSAGLTSDHNYSWYPGRSSNSLEKEFGKSMTVRTLNAYSVD